MIKNSFEQFQLTGKTALITGGAGLMGAEHASALIESGAAVVICDINEARLHSVKKQLMQRFKNSKLYVQIMDVTDPVSINKNASELAAKNIRIDILINNAAIDPKVSGNEGLQETSRLEQFSLESWNKQISVGLTGAFLCAQVFGSKMAADGKGGVILNIASDLSVFSPDQRLYRNEKLPETLQPVKPVTYSVIKTGLVGLTRYLATYWTLQHVRCNALSPGGIYNGQSDEFVKRLSSLIPMGRMASKDEYRATIQYLCSDASSYMNGQNIVLDGGRSVW
jgi:NAD(P)-dependent dehydrogenase (short-subunit alcohol dehydrogenase family)